MRVLGIDPGSLVTGFGCIDVQSRDLSCVEAGILRPPRGREMAERLGFLLDGITKLLATHQPDVVSIERVFVNRNVRSALVLGQARGLVLAAAGSAGVSVSEYSASQIKLAVVGTGRADKEQVRHMVGILLGMNVSEQPLDCTDALACAVCHAHSAGMTTKTGLPAGARWSRGRARR